MHDPFKVEKRKPLTTKQRVELFRSSGGKCCICGLPIQGAVEGWDVYEGEDFIDEHIEPLWRNGTNDLKNRGVAHVKCARKKTAKEATDRSKVRRTALKMYGFKKSKNPMRGGKRDVFKKKLNGTVVRRDED
jgi:5-methylcytosine-specific restriction endonuclease McrA